MGFILSGGFGCGMGLEGLRGLLILWYYQGSEVSIIDDPMDIYSQLCLLHALSTVLSPP